MAKTKKIEDTVEEEIIVEAEEIEITPEEVVEETPEEITPETPAEVITTTEARCTCGGPLTIVHNRRGEQKFCSDCGLRK